MREMQEMWVRSLGWEDPFEEEMGTYSSILAWRIPWTGHRESDTTDQASRVATTDDPRVSGRAARTLCRAEGAWQLKAAR